MSLKLKIGVIASIISIFILSVNAYAQGVFLCMRDGDDTALFSDGESALRYIDMTSSNGATVYPMISTDGNTYLPFRFMCEIAGLKDKSSSLGMLDEGSFRFTDRDVNDVNSTQQIEINYNGNIVSHEVGVEFSYEAYEGDIRNVCIYNIEGSLYFPMTYMAKLTDSSTFWNDETRDIIFVSNNLNPYDFIDDAAYIHNKLLYENGYYNGYNNLNVSPIYLDDSGKKIIKSSENIICSAKTNGILYHLTEDGDIKYLDESGNPKTMNFKADTIVAVKNRLYGIERDTKKGFVCNLNGEGFKYITDRAIYNLILREYKNEYYLYYGDYNDRSSIYMMPIKTMDNYCVEITDYAHNNLLVDMQKFVIGTKHMAYLDSKLQLHTIKIDDPIEEFEIALVKDENYKIHINSEDGGVLSNIDNINLDVYNDALYISQTKENEGVFYSLLGDTIIRLDDRGIDSISFFKDADGLSVLGGLYNGSIINEYIMYEENGVIM